MTARASVGQTKQERAERTRAQLRTAAASLIAQWGIEATNLRDIGRASDQRNNSVVQYHYGTKAALLAAVFDERLPGLIERHRDAAVGNTVEQMSGEDLLTCRVIVAVISSPAWRSHLSEHPVMTAAFPGRSLDPARFIGRMSLAGLGLLFNPSMVDAGIWGFDT